MPFTVRKGRVGFNGELLASMSLTDAYKAFPKQRKDVVKDAHEEAVAIKKAIDAKSK